MAGAFQGNAFQNNAFQTGFGFTVNAVVKKTIAPPGFTVGAEIIAGGSFTANALKLQRYGDWRELVARQGMPRLWYRLNEASGGLVDYGLEGRNASTVTGTPLYGQNGTIEGAISFNSTQAFATASFALNLTNSVITIEAWVWPAATGGTRQTIYSGNDVAGAPSLELDTDVLRVAAIINGTFVAVSANNSYVPETWNHVVYTRSGNGASTHAIWVNAVSKSLITNNANNYTSTTAVKRIGERTSGVQRFVGLIDEVIVYDRVISAAEIAAHYGVLATRATVDAQLVGTFTRTFTVNAVVKKTIAPPGFTVDAQTSLPFFRLNAQIAGPLVKIFGDTFTRTTTPQSFLSLWHWIEYDSIHGDVNQVKAYTDGSRLVLPNQPGGWYDSYVGFPLPVTGEAYFDFWVPATWSGNGRPTYGLNLDPYDYTGIFVRFQDGATQADLSQFGSDTPFVFTPTASTMYRVHARWNGTTVNANVWAASGSEPGGWQYTQPQEFASWSIIGPLFRWPPFLDLYYFPENEDGYVDNVEIWTQDGTWKGFGAFQLQAQIVPPPHFLVDAVLRKTQAGSFPVRAWIRTSFTVDAWLTRTSFQLDAVIRQRLSASSGAFLLSAHISRSFFHLDAVVGPGGRFTLNAVLKKNQPKTFILDAEVFAGTRLRSFRVNANVRRGTTGSWYANAELRLPHVEHDVTFPVDAVIREPGVGGSFDVDARIFDGVQTGSFTINADTKGQGEKRGTFTVSAIVRLKTSRAFAVNALIGGNGYFRLDAYIRPYFRLDAELVASTILTRTGSFTIDARVFNGREFKVYALIKAKITRSFGVWAEIFAPGTQGGRYFWLDAFIYTSSGTKTFVLDAQVRGGGAFTLDAFVRPSFTIDAFIRSNDVVIWPDDGGPATDPDGNPLPPGFKSARKYQVRITIDGTDITGDVNWSRTSFTQNAKTNPGTFELVLYGPQPYNGGEEILVELDGFRTFGGYVLQIERGYVFESDADWPVTFLRGADFNVLFDKLITYNRASADDPSGKYTPYKSFAKGSLDTRIINKVFGSYVDLPPGFDYKLFVDSVGVAAPEKPWAMPTSGSPLRQVMQSLSQVTDAVWWIDPYLRLHYGSRTQVTAPFPITDGAGGISSRQLSMSEDISQLVTDGFLWGTLAYTVDGEIKVEHQHSSYYASLGPWQYGEFRSDIHHTKYLERRMDSVIERYGKPIKRAQVVIFEPGYQAGQVVDLRLTEHGLEAPLVIRSMVLTFAVGKEPDGTKYYCVPRFELSIGLDPEEPWDIYDYLPFPNTPYDDPGGWTRCNDCEGNCIDDNGGPGGGGGGGGCSDEVCGITDSFSREINVAWGTTDAGIDWDTTASGVAMSIDGNSAIMNYPGVASYPVTPNATALLPMSSDRVRYAFTITSDGTPTGGGHSAFTAVIANTYQVMYQHSTGGAKTLTLHHYAFPTTTSEPISWSPTVGQKYQLRWEVDAGVEQRVRVWPDGDPEPSSWTIVQDLTGLSNAAGTTYQFHWSLDLYAGIFGSTVGPFGVALDNLDIEGVNRCGAVQFDDFNRTVSGGLGVSTDGHQWYQDDLFGGIDVSVDGQANFLYDAAQTGGVTRYDTGNFVAGPWNTASAWEMTFLVNWSMMANTGGSGSPDAGVAFYLVAGSDTSETPAVRLDWTNGPSPYVPYLAVTAQYFTGPYTFSYPALTAGSDYMVKWGYTGTEIRAKLWAASAAEPSTWDVTCPVSISFANKPLNFRTSYHDQSLPFGHTVDREIHVEFIEFDYVGKPCYDDTNCNQFDEFNRTVAGGWGSSTSGLPWTVSGLGTAAVNGTAGTLTSLDEPFAPSSVGAIVDGSGPWDGPFTMSARFMFSAVGTNRGVINFDMTDASARHEILQIAADTTGYNFGIGSFDITHAGFAQVAFAANTWYLVEWVWPSAAGGTSTATVWAEGATKPTSPTVSRTKSYAPETPGAYFNVGWLVTNAHITDTVTLDYIRFNGADCNCDDSEAQTWADQGWAWAAGAGAGLEASSAWSLSGNAASLIEPTGGVDSVVFTLDEADNPGVFAKLQAGPFTIRGVMTIPYNLPVGSGTVLAGNAFQVGFNSHGITPSVASLETIIGGALGGRILLYAPGITNQDTRFPNIIGAGTWPWSMTVTSTSVSASIAGYGLSVSGSFNLSTIDRLVINMGDGSNPPVLQSGTWMESGLSIQYSDGTTEGLNCHQPVGSGDGGGGDPSAPGGPCYDPDGETFGAVTQGWGCETLRVTGGSVDLTGQAAQGTLTVYDADTGDFIDLADFNVDDGKTVTLPGGHARVIACYRNYTPEIGSNPSVPRLPNASVGRRYE